MACSSPMVAGIVPGRTANGKVRYKFLGKATNWYGPAPVNGKIQPCKQCLECRIAYSQSWAVRLMHESKSHENACFLTLTYDNENLPKNASLNPTHLQTFWRDLRARLNYHYEEESNTKIKYFAVGEYGDKTQRPHYHAALFGGPFSVHGDVRGRDQEGDSHSGGRQFTHDDIAQVWPYGIHRYSELTFESAAYVARYIVKKVSGTLKEVHYGDRESEFSRSSNGIGKAFAELWKEDIYPHDKVVIPGTGSFAVPQYYDRILEKVDPALFAYVKLQREREAPTSDEWYQQLADRVRTGGFNKLRQKEFGKRLVE